METPNTNKSMEAAEEDYTPATNKYKLVLEERHQKTFYVKSKETTEETLRDVLNKYYKGEIVLDYESFFNLIATVTDMESSDHKKVLSLKIEDKSDSLWDIEITKVREEKLTITSRAESVEHIAQIAKNCINNINSELLMNNIYYKVRVVNKNTKEEYQLENIKVGDRPVVDDMDPKMTVTIIEKFPSTIIIQADSFKSAIEYVKKNYTTTKPIIKHRGELCEKVMVVEGIPF